jgi:hypothetical protein
LSGILGSFYIARQVDATWMAINCLEHNYALKRGCL